MSNEIETPEDPYNDKLRKHLEEKYNINLDIQTKVGEKTYWDLREYFTKEIEMNHILISTDYGTMCCMRTDIIGMKEEFNKKLEELIQGESTEVCKDPHADLLEAAVGHPCQYSANFSSNLENNDIH